MCDCTSSIVACFAEENATRGAEVFDVMRVPIAVVRELVRTDAGRAADGRVSAAVAVGAVFVWRGDDERLTPCGRHATVGAVAGGKGGIIPV